MLNVPADEAKNLTFSNRIFETTQRTQPRGIDIPVVREGNFFAGPQTFLGVPAGAGVRASIRVYDPWIHIFDPLFFIPPTFRPGPMLEGVEVRVMDGLETLGSVILRPAVFNRTIRPVDFHKPGFAAIYDLATIAPGVADRVNVHIRVRPIPAGAQYYAMVAVTDNETQTVSIITAQ